MGLVNGIFAGIGAAAHAAAEAGMTAAGSGGTVGYSVDRDQIPALIEKLEKAKDRVRNAGMLAEGAERFPAPGKDPYSPAAAEKMGPDLVENHRVANEQYQQDIQNLIDSLKAAMASYDEAEHAGQSTFRRKA